MAYRIRDGRVVDTLADAGCIGRKTSSSPYGPDGRWMYWSPEGPKPFDHWTDGCRGYRE